MAVRLSKIAIIGVGSPFGTDSLGWRAIERLEQARLSQEFPHYDLVFKRSDRPGALLLEQLRGVEGAILIDAMQSGLPPGSVRRFSVEQLNHDSGLVSTHGFGVAEALSLGMALSKTSNADLLPQRLAVIGIEMGTDELNESWQFHLYTLVQQTLSGWSSTSVAQ